jgi:hypothetical protein
VSQLRYELGFYIPEDDILHSHRRENLCLTCIRFCSLRSCKYSNLTDPMKQNPYLVTDGPSVVNNQPPFYAAGDAYSVHNSRPLVAPFFSRIDPDCNIMKFILISPRSSLSSRLPAQHFCRQVFIPVCSTRLSFRS